MDTAAQSLSFDVKIPEGHTVKFTQEVTFENFVGQFQPYCTKLLCVVDGTSLYYYDKTGPLPTNIRFDYKQRRGTLTEYYFRDIETDTLYCVFGYEAARLFYPRIDSVDPTGAQEMTSSLVQPTKLTKSTTIINPSKPVNKRNSNAHAVQQLPIDSRKLKRLPIVQPVKSQMPLFREVKREQVIGTTPPATLAMPITPKHVVIIDKGVKMTFPNPNYPVEIRTYYGS